MLQPTRILIIVLLLFLSACSEASGDSPDSGTANVLAETAIDQGFPPQTVISCADCLLVGVTGIIDGDTDLPPSNVSI